jgi:hypothetical protein
VQAVEQPSEITGNFVIKNSNPSWRTEDRGFFQICKMVQMKGISVKMHIA